MRFRNFLPLVLFLLFVLPGGVGFLFAWQGFPLVMSLMQLAHALLMVLVFRASLRSAAKNHGAQGEVPRQAYLPLKFNVGLYVLFGQPIIWLFADRFGMLMTGYLMQLAGFSFACYSGMLYVTRSAPAKVS